MLACSPPPAPPSLEELLSVCGPLSPQWQKLGAALDVPESELDAIGQAREKDEASCMEELLKVGGRARTIEPPRSNVATSAHLALPAPVHIDRSWPLSLGELVTSAHHTCMGLIPSFP